VSARRELLHVADLGSRQDLRPGWYLVMNDHVLGNGLSTSPSWFTDRDMVEVELSMRGRVYGRPPVAVRKDRDGRVYELYRAGEKAVRLISDLSAFSPGVAVWRENGERLLEGLEVLKAADVMQGAA
jgi:hypothetical protein